MIEYLCNKKEVEQNAINIIDKLVLEDNINNIFVFPDVHFSSEQSIPVGVCFDTTNVIYPLISGKDIGCGVMFGKISKKDLLNPIDKLSFKSLYQSHLKMTDDGLGGGNHFLSIEEDDENIYILCHTGSRNLGIYFYNKSLAMVNQYSFDINKKVEYLPIEIITEEYKKEYQSVLDFAYNRRFNFIIKTMEFFQRAKYIKSVNPILNNYLTSNNKSDYKATKFYIHGVDIEIQDSFHNYIEFKDDKIIHRKGATGINLNQQIAIPISMTRGTMIVKLKYEYALNSCAHGAGRIRSRYDSIEYFNSLKQKDKKYYYDNFKELLNNGKFDNSLISEFDFAYKDISEIFNYQHHIYKVTETKPILTIKTLNI
jgi:tRNA-splicing ligase RtcB/release factor H-coupled RctB family protein